MASTVSIQGHTEQSASRVHKEHENESKTNRNFILDVIKLSSSYERTDFSRLQSLFGADSVKWMNESARKAEQANSKMVASQIRKG